MNIYNLTTEILSLENKLLETVDQDTGELDEMICKELAVRKEEFNTKALQIADLYRSLEAEEKAVDEEIARLSEMLCKIGKVKDRIKSNLASACVALGVEKIDGIHSNISFRTSEQTVIDDENLIPDEFKKVKTVITVDKTKIKNGIKLGMEIAGAHLEQKLNIQIK